VTGLAFGPGGAELVLVTAAGTRQADGQFRGYGWDLVGREVAPLGGATGVRFQLGAPAVSPDGDAVAFAGRSLDWYAGGKWEPKAFPASGRCEAVVFSPGGKYLAAAGADGAIRVLGVKSRKAIREWAAHDGGVAALAVSPDGKRVASAGTEGGIGLWDFTAGARVRVWETGRAPASSVWFLPDGRLASFHAPGDKAAVRVWSADADGPVSKLALGGVLAVALSADGRLLGTAGQDGAVGVWETAGLLPPE
jgi:WD40 repeat protein